MPDVEKRPTFDATLKAAAVASLAAQLEAAGHIPAGEREDRISQLTASIRSQYCNGYDIAKVLDDREGWNITVDLVDDLDAWSTHASEAVQEAETSWALRNNIQPQLKPGERVEFGDRKERGYIHGVYKYGPAKYEIRVDGTPDNQFRIVNFEDCISIQGEGKL